MSAGQVRARWSMICCVTNVRRERVLCPEGRGLKGFVCLIDCPKRWDNQNRLSQVSEHSGLAKGDTNKAERSGFEPEMPVSRHTGLAIRRFRPLSHLSGSFAARPREGPADSANIVRNQPKSKVI